MRVQMKDFFSVCQKKIDAFFERVYDHLAAYMEDKEINRYSFREFALEDKLDNVKLDNKFLQFQLTKTRADLYELQKRPQELRNIISRILLMSDEELQKSSRFSVRRAESGPGWETASGFCCLGGCDMDVYPFPSKRDALLFAALLKAVGYQPPHNIACAECYQEYMSEQLQGGIDIYVQ